MEHTKEPWYLSPQSGYIRHGSVHGWNIARIEGQEPYTKANAERIVTCVNAMQGLTNEQVESLRETVKELREALEKLNISVTNYFSLEDGRKEVPVLEVMILKQMSAFQSKAEAALTRSKHLS